MSEKLTLEINGALIAYKDPIPGVMITPPINEDYWLMRVGVGYDQYVVLFPKFGVYGIGFLKEANWNANLPSDCYAEQIYNHIKMNKGDERISRKTCIAAIRLLQKGIQEANVKPPVSAGSTSGSITFRV